MRFVKNIFVTKLNFLQQNNFAPIYHISCSVSIANAGKVLSEDCADLAVGFFVDVLRKISAGDRFVC